MRLPLVAVLTVFSILRLGAPSSPVAQTGDDSDDDDCDVGRILVQLVDQVRKDLQEEREERIQVVGELTRKISQLENKNRQLENKTEQLENQNRQLATKVSKQNTHVAFAAKLRNHRNSGVGVIVYNSVITNKGGAYNPLNGVFTAPVDGVYFFSVNGLSNSNAQAAVSLVQNNVEKCAGYARPGVHQTGTCEVVLSLRLGDQVKVLAGPNIPGVSYHVSHNFFSGFLLFAN